MAKGTRQFRATRRLETFDSRCVLDTSAHARLDLVQKVARDDRRVFVIWHADASPFRDERLGRCGVPVKVR
jgi:hypothetical protein